MEEVRIVSDGSSNGFECYDSKGNVVDLTRCIGIDIKVRAVGLSEATFKMLGAALDIKAIKVNAYEEGESPVQSVFFWKGKEIGSMDGYDCMEALDWVEAERDCLRDSLGTTLFAVLVEERMEELGRGI